MLENVALVETSKGRRGEPVEVYQVKSPSFRATYLTTPTFTREYVEEELRRRARSIANRRATPTGVNTRCNQFQKALAYIGEHRHLIPFFRFVYEFLKADRSKGISEAVKSWKKQMGALPVEIEYDRSGWGYSYYSSYSLGYRCPSLDAVVDQVPYIPKAWLL